MNSLQAICNELLSDLLNELTGILTNPDPIKRYATASRLSRKKIEQLRDLIDTHLFESKEAEIWLFKVMKPEFTRLVVYYTCLQKFYLNWPPGEKAQEEYMRMIIGRIETFFHEHRDFYRYHRSGNTMFDELYFLRCNYDPLMNFDPNDAMNDPNFTTNYDHILGQLLAYQDLERFFREDKIFEPQTIITLDPMDQVLWAHTDTDWVDLLKSLSKRQAFYRPNGREVTIHDVHARHGSLLGLTHVDVPALNRNIENRKGTIPYIERLPNGKITFRKDDK